VPGGVSQYFPMNGRLTLKSSHSETASDRQPRNHLGHSDVFEQDKV